MKKLFQLLFLNQNPPSLKALARQSQKHKKAPIKMENIIVPQASQAPIETSEPINKLSHRAMISSYSSDYMSASKLKQEVSKRKKRRSF